ncbi:hypothetical protein QBC41DRAFT_354253 [Cercophora samala]|uniref:Uncharacterized protein n=1 Tax=Cercophora samala TaxID=330535 RepID=A0AA39ZI19_9PEZI|nr:hypothetical protein QBC41DRAFT_354253 [Cercophora samala]
MSLVRYVHAKRALATSTNSLITTTGAVGGMVVGGPAGAIAGGAANVIITTVGKSAAVVVTTGSLASLVQGASKNVFNNTPNVKEPEPKPPKVKKVTQNQDTRCKNLIQDLKAFVPQYLVYSLNDAYATVHLYRDPVVIAGYPWAPANEAVPGQYDAFQRKKAGSPASNEKPLHRKIYEKLKQILDDHNHGTQLTGNKLKIMNMILGKEPGGFNAVWIEIESPMSIMDLRLQGFSELMASEADSMD